MENFEDRLKRMEYYQSLLLQMSQKEGFAFYHLIIENQLTEEEVAKFYELCESLCKEYEDLKAEKFVFYSPLFIKFKERLNPKLDPKEVIMACINQKIFPELMQTLKKNIS